MSLLQKDHLPQEHLRSQTAIFSRAQNSFVIILQSDNNNKFSQHIEIQNATVVTPGYESHHDCLNLAGWSSFCTLVSVIHPDMLIRLNFWSEVRENLHTDSHQNMWIFTSKKGQKKKKHLNVLATTESELSQSNKLRLGEL